MFYQVRRTRIDNWKEFNNPENNLWVFFVCFREKHDLQSPSNYTGNEKSQNKRCSSSQSFTKNEKNLTDIIWWVDIRWIIKYKTSWFYTPISWSNNSIDPISYRSSAEKSGLIRKGLGFLQSKLKCSRCFLDFLRFTREKRPERGKSLDESRLFPR